MIPRMIASQRKPVGMAGLLPFARSRRGAATGFGAGLLAAALLPVLSLFMGSACCSPTLEPVSQFGGTVECCGQIEEHTLGVDSPEEIIITLRWTDPTVNLDLRVSSIDVERESTGAVGRTEEQVRMPANVLGATYTIEVIGDSEQSQDYIVEVSFETRC